MEEGKVKAIRYQLAPKSIAEVKNFYGLTNSMEGSSTNSNTIAAPLTDCLKLFAFEQWNEATQQSFDALQSALSVAPFLQVPDFQKVFELDCDASSVGNGCVLSHKGKPIALLNVAKMKYYIYDQELYNNSMDF